MLSLFSLQPKMWHDKYETQYFPNILGKWGRKWAWAAPDMRNPARNMKNYLQ